MMASKKTSKQKRDDGASELSIKTRSDLNAPPPRTREPRQDAPDKRPERQMTDGADKEE